MTQIIYTKNGIRVEIHGSLIVRLPDGRILYKFDVGEVNAAIETADEIAEKLAA